jgi:hypothetical protein
VAKSLHAGFSSTTADQIDNALRQMPEQFYRDKYGLFMSDVDGVPTAREELVSSNLAEKIPIWGAIVRFSNRNMSTGLNLLRTAAFDDFVRRNPNATDAELFAMANWTNINTGRGDLGFLKPIANELALGILAPRFAASRLQVPFQLLRYWQLPRVRAEIAKDYAATLAAGIGILTLADLNGLSVGLDPREPDFGKLRFGDSRVDLWGGVQQPVRLMARTALGLTDTFGWTGKHLTDAEVEAYDPVEMLGRFTAFKFSPLITLPRELATGRNAVGEDVTGELFNPDVRDWLGPAAGPSETLVRSVLPLVLEDVRDAYQNGPSDAAISGALNFFGAGTQTYGDSEAATRRNVRRLRADGDHGAARTLISEWNAENPNNRIAP